MAYTIISQNNTTTTLSDENGNVITVPARVTLATSTDYTIIKVNNNSVDLESGDGKIIRGVPACVVLAGGGDDHNKGYYTDLTALQTAYPTAEAGDWAIVGATDTVWIWDEDTSAWVDSDQKGQVTSVNNQTGAVVLGAQDVGAVPQYSSMPQASEDELGNIYQFTGTTDATYTNGYFYKCVSDGGNPATYSWSQVSVQPVPSGLPDQTGQSGKFLTTDGTDASWGDALANKAVKNRSMLIGASATEDSSAGSENIGIGSSVTIDSFVSGSIAIGTSAYAKNYSIAIGYGAQTYSSGINAIAIGRYAYASANRAIQIGTGANSANNSDADTFKVANNNGNFMMMDANGNLPADRLASTTGLADGNYRLRLVMASGVPTLEWVAE